MVNRHYTGIKTKSGFHSRNRREKSISILMLLQYWESVHEKGHARRELRQFNFEFQV